MSLLQFLVFVHFGNLPSQNGTYMLLRCKNLYLPVNLFPLLDELGSLGVDFGKFNIFVTDS